MRRYVWEEAHGLCLFHYTEYAAAESIADSLIGRPGSGAHYGFGFYATNLAPCRDVEQIHRRIFPDGRARIWDAVVVLEITGVNPFVRETEHDFRFPGDPHETD